MKTIRAAAWMLVCVLGGCQAPDAGAIGRYVVKAKNAPFYKYGPAQSSGPDMTLNKGQALSVFRQQMGFAQVVLDNGVSGYVASSDLQPDPGAPRELPESRPEAPTKRSGRATREPDFPMGEPADPRAVEEPLGLPVLPDPGLFAPLPSGGEPQSGSDAPAPDGKPTFRY
jgi:hypothetical protein